MAKIIESQVRATQTGRESGPDAGPAPMISCIFVPISSKNGQNGDVVQERYTGIDNL